MSLTHLKFRQYSFVFSAEKQDISLAYVQRVVPHRKHISDQLLLSASHRLEVWLRQKEKCREWPGQAIEVERVSDLRSAIERSRSLTTGSTQHRALCPTFAQVKVSRLCGWEDALKRSANARSGCQQDSKKLGAHGFDSQGLQPQGRRLRSTEGHYRGRAGILVPFPVPYA